MHGMTTAIGAQGIALVDLGPTEAPAARTGNWQQVEQRLRTLSAQYRAQVEPRALAHAAIAAWADSVDDSHTQFIGPREYAAYSAPNRGDARYGGIGMRMRGPEPTIVDVYADSPAAAVGLGAGDVIVAVDNEPVVWLRLDEIVQRVPGPAGSPLRLRVRHALSGQEGEVTLTRAPVDVPFVERRLLGDLGYVSLLAFPEPAVVDTVEAAIAELQTEGARA